MKKQPTYQQLPLDEDDKQMLMTIYKTRQKYSLIFYAFMTLMVAFLSYEKVSGLSNSSNPNYLVTNSTYARQMALQQNISSQPYKRKPLQVEAIVLIFIGYSVLGIPILLAGLYYFRKKIRPFKKDVKNGVKNKVPYIIMRKEYFEYTGQFYFGLDDPSYLHHEVDEALFRACNEGDTIYLYRAPLSGYTFEMNGRFTL